MQKINWRYLIIMFVLFGFMGLTSAQASDNALVETGEQLQGIAGELWQRVIDASQTGVMPLVLLIGGAVMLFLGFRIYNLIIALAGALVGSLIAVAIVNSTNTLLTTIAMVVGASVGAFLAIAVYYLAIFSIGAYIGGFLALQALANFDVSFDPLLVVIFGGIMGGLVLVGLSFELLVVISSIVGGQLIALVLGLNSIWVVGLIIFGIIWQITLAKVLGYKIRRRPTRRLLFREA